MGIFDPKQVSTQEHLDIEDIRDDLVVLKNGIVSAVIETTSVNFDLLAGQEQDSRIYTFAGLLNSLTFPIQIVIRTQQTDISKYIVLLNDYKKKVASVPLQQQVTIYQDFITNLTATTQILNKRFYVIVPTTTINAVKTSGWKLLFGKQEQIVNISDVLEKAKIELNPKRDHIIKELANMGLAARQLRNDELIKLYYSIYEPDKVGLEVLNIREDNLSGAIVNTGSGDDQMDIAADVVEKTNFERKPLNVVGATSKN